MSVAAHLHIRLDEYDARIRTFIPRYDEMIDAAARALSALEDGSAHVVDLGTGTGALASRCLQVRPDASLIAVDEDAGILDLARRRLEAQGVSASFAHASFADFVLPPCDAVVASLALHHIRTAEAKRAMYRKCRSALRAGGLLVSADCCPSSHPRLAALERDAWRAHLHLTYSPEEAEGFFTAWAEDDVYFCLPDELAMLRDAGFAPDVVWRHASMAVIAAR
jgi:spermidine synthase